MSVEKEKKAPSEHDHVLLPLDDPFGLRKISLGGDVPSLWSVAMFYRKQDISSNNNHGSGNNGKGEK